MRVCHIISSFRPVIGGAERATETLCHALVAQGMDVVVLTRRYSADDPAFQEIAGIPVYRLGLPGRTKRHALTFAAHAAFRLAWQFRRYGVVHVQNIDTPMLVGFVARIVLRRRLIATIHGEAPLLGARTSRLGRLRLRLMVKLVDRFTTINPENARILHELGVAPHHTFDVPNGIDTDRFRPPTDPERREARVSLGLSETDLVVLYQGRLVPFKRVDLLIDAWAQLPADDRRQLLIVGVGATAEALQEQAERLGLSVRFEGPTDTPITYLRAADAFVLPSGDDQMQAYEGLSVALLEAMAVGVVPVVTQGPGNDVLVQDDVTGMSFPMGDSIRLADCLSRLLVSPEIRARLARAAHDRVYEEYAATKVAERIEGVYRDVA